VIEKARTYERLHRENERLAQWVAYLHTDAGKEWAARAELGLVAAGERVIRLSRRQTPKSQAPLSFADRTHNWLVTVRRRATNWLHHVGLVFRVWLGLEEVTVAESLAPRSYFSCFQELGQEDKKDQCTLYSS